MKIWLTFMVGILTLNCWAIDTYNPSNGQLTIPTVLVGNNIYTNVVVTVSSVVAVNGGKQTAFWDTYNSSTGQLTIPSVSVGANSYYNAVATIGNILSIGGILNANPNLTSAGLWSPVSDPNFINANYFGTLANTFHSIIRIGKNGQYGLISNGWGYVSFSQPSTAPVIPVNVGLLEPLSDGTLQLNTPKYINDTITNGSGSVVVADFNGDGRDDIFLAAHNESPLIDKPSTAYLSNPDGTFSKIRLNDSVAAHDAQLVNLRGKPAVLASTYRGDSSPIYQFSNGNFVETQVNQYFFESVFNGENTFNFLVGCTATLSNFGKNGSLEFVAGDVTVISKATQKYFSSSIGVRSFTEPNNISNTAIQTVTPYLSTLPQFQKLDSGLGVGLTHTYRVWAEDLNHDGYPDVIAGQSMFPNSTPSALQILINKGDGTFAEATAKLNPDISLNVGEFDYTPTFLDIDNSGINSFFFAGAITWNEPSIQSNFVLLNDGTGRIYVALHDQFALLYEIVSSFYSQHIGTYPYLKNTIPKFIAIPQADGSINFLVELKVNGPKVNGFSLDSLQYINYPAHYNPKTDFTQNIIVSDRNNSMLIRTWAGNDVFYDNNANSKPTKIDGGLGTNKVVYSGSSSQYSVTKNTSGTVSVVSMGSAPIQVNDTLTNIQVIQFSDKQVSLN